ncbi:MAG: hypothetical protein IPH37_11405 [Burkholderiales bacterium]|nr:hypothetical protein [Burkholderiales bacterium]
MRYGLQGKIPDGLLFRVSSFVGDDTVSFQLQDRFWICSQMSPQFAPRNVV